MKEGEVIMSRRPQLKSAKRQREWKLLDWENKQQISQESTVLMQIHKSHIQRMEDFLQGRQQQEQLFELQMRVVGCCDTDSRSISLMGIKTTTTTSSNHDNHYDHANKLEAWFRNLPFSIRGLNKLYSVNPLKSFLSSDNDKNSSIATEVARRCLDEIAALMNDNPNVKIRLNVFPPPLVASLFHEFQTLQTENDDTKILLNTLSPTGFTHTLDMVQIMTSKGRKRETRKKLYLLGTRPVPKKNASTKSQVLIGETNHLVDSPKNEICRAYLKLQEAFFRYDYSLPSFRTTSSSTPNNNNKVVALDCGAAPGGWTRFLLDQMPDDLEIVYSVDPAQLSPVVANHPRVCHLAMKAEDAMEQYFKNNSKKENIVVAPGGDGDALIHLWVSDMCLNQMSRQVDVFLAYKECGLVGPGTFFVLTLKCKVGHSRESYDAQVAEQRARLLENGACHLQTLHLFANRNGERTLMGYLN